MLNASWRAGWVASNVRSMGLTSKDGFDGLALDIEDFAGNATLRDALTSLVCELRAAMTAALPGSQLSFAAAADPATNAAHYDYAGIARCLEAGDFIFPMGYCMSEAKHTNVGSPNSPLPAVKRGLTNYQQLGVKASNLVLGLPFFGFDVPCVDNASEAGCTIEPGSWSTSQFEAGYGIIQEVLLPLAGGAKALRWNDSAASPWFDYHKRGSKGLERHRVYFDDPRSILDNFFLKNKGGPRVYTGLKDDKTSGAPAKSSSKEPELDVIGDSCINWGALSPKEIAAAFVMLKGSKDEATGLLTSVLGELEGMAERDDWGTNAATSESFFSGDKKKANDGKASVYTGL